MYRLLRSVAVKSGAGAQALQLAQESADYINKKYPDVSIGTYVQLFGSLGKIVWIADYENLNLVEEIGQKLAMDDDYLTLLGNLGNLVIEGSWKDELFRSV
ncbi:MAG: hypothetical protein GY847_19910 [Proteobacteria bacterium]|nr:hypothetical protein [Pseudomonadota bacterium]